LLLNSTSSDSWPFLTCVPVLHRGFCNSCISQTACSLLRVLTVGCHSSQKLTVVAVIFVLH
jgi:hypothetical protein